MSFVSTFLYYYYKEVMFVCMCVRGCSLWNYAYDLKCNGGNMLVTVFPGKKDYNLCWFKNFQA